MKEVITSVPVGRAIPFCPTPFAFKIVNRHCLLPPHPLVFVPITLETENLIRREIAKLLISREHHSKNGRTRRVAPVT